MCKVIKILITIIVVFCLFLFFWPYVVKEGIQERDEISSLIINNNEFKVEVADTPEKREKGLSGREYLPEDTVLLFVFSESEKHGIWMKDMLFSIDIVWLDENYYVVDFKEDVSPETFPEAFYPKKKALYVVEGSVGFVEDNDVAIGDRINLY